MAAQSCVFLVTVLLSAPPAEAKLSAEAKEWNNIIDAYLVEIKGIKAPTSFGRTVIKRIETLLRAHPLSHVQVFVEKNGGQRTLAADLYYGKGELHIIQHSMDVGFPNLVIKDNNAYEWKVGKRSGQSFTMETKDLVVYTVYVTDPATFALDFLDQYLKDPNLFEAPCPGEDGCTELRIKKSHGMTAIEVDLKTFWIGAVEYGHQKNGKPLKYIYSKPKAIKAIPDKVFDRLKRIRFRETKGSILGHIVYP